MGRGRKLNNELIENITRGIHTGMYTKDACKACNIDQSTYYYWLEKGREEAKLPEEERTIYFRFMEEVTRAKYIFERRNLELIDKASEDGDWRAAQFKLAMYKPERYAQVTRVIDNSTGVEHIEKMHIHVKRNKELFKNGSANNTKEEK